MSHVPTGDGQNSSDQDATSPAVPQEPPNSEECIDLPTYVSLIAEQSRTASDSVRLSEAPNPEEPEEKLERLPEPNCDDQLSDPNRTEVKEDHAQRSVVTGDASTRETRVESDKMVPLDHSVNEEREEAPLLGLPVACLHPVTSPLFFDPQRENARRGCLTSSKVMKRSSSVISDSGIESEPSSVAWPLDAALRGRPPQDFSSELEILQQVVCRRPVHRSSLEGLQVESNGSLPSAGIQASLTSISSLPYEEDQQQRQLSKLTKSVSAPQISSPEDTEEERTLPNQDAQVLVEPQDLCPISCSLPSGDCNSPSLVDSGLTPHRVLNGAVVMEMSAPSQDRSEALRSMSALSGPSEVLLLRESTESPRVKEGAVIDSRGGSTNHQTHTSGASSPVEHVHFVESEVVPRSHGNNPCVQNQSSNEAGDECQSSPQSEQSCLDPSQSPLEPSEFQCSGDPPGRPTCTAERPSDLTGLLLDNVTPPAALSEVPSADKEPSEGQAKPAKIPNSGLAFVNKKMVEMVNMSVSCAPTCLPFSSVLRDSPSISGMSPRQATSPITHQPLGSFGIISSSSLNPLNMEDATNERMLK